MVRTARIVRTVHAVQSVQVQFAGRTVRGERYNKAVGK